MNGLLLVWALVGLLIHVVFALVVLLGAGRIRRIRDMSLRPREVWPRVSIVIPARNEQRDIQVALASVLELDYPDFEVIAVDDRSTDRTGAMLDEFAASQPRLRVVHLEQLPPGWLGKNHALQCGADRASGELLLFTDADVRFERLALRFAVQYLLDEELDHVAATPHMRMPSLLLESFVVTFMLFFSIYFRPWKARDPKSRAYIGIGAFNLIRARAYRDIDGHRPIAMRPDDDVELGHLLKLRGKRQDVIDGVGALDVPWYASVAELIRGLEKNAFSGVDYRIWIVVGSTLISLLFNFGPFLMVFVADGVSRWMFLASALIAIGLCAAMAMSARLNPLSAFGFPLSVLLFVYIQWRTMLITLVRGGIRWRDTFYPLSELKANRLE